MWIERDNRIDLVLLTAIISLIGIGLVMIYSTSSITASAMHDGNSAFFLKKQLVSAAIGLFMMIFMVHFNHEKLRHLVWPALILSIVLLIVVLIPGIGRVINGSRRWLRFAGLSFQPSELSRLALTLYLAHSLTRKEGDIKTFTKGMLPYLIICGVMIALVLVEPDLGGASTLGIVMFLMLLVAGASWTHLVPLASAAVVAFFYFMISEPYRWQRFLATINPWKYWYGAGWHLIQSFLAFGGGGLFGLGLGEGRQKLWYLPDAHTDFIFSVIGEELGLCGVVFVVALFLTIAVRGLRIAVRASSPFGTFLAFGLTIMIAVPGLINMLVVMGLAPTKGLVLPFVSYGGSALIMYMTAAGILLNVSAHRGRQCPD
jgi:cell division protein FtsW